MENVLENLGLKVEKKDIVEQLEKAKGDRRVRIFDFEGFEALTEMLVENLKKFNNRNSIMAFTHSLSAKYFEEQSNDKAEYDPKSTVIQYKIDNDNKISGVAIKEGNVKIFSNPKYSLANPIVLIKQDKINGEKTFKVDYKSFAKLREDKLLQKPFSKESWFKEGTTIKEALDQIADGLIAGNYTLHQNLLTYKGQEGGSHFLSAIEKKYLDEIVSVMKTTIELNELEAKEKEENKKDKKSEQEKEDKPKKKSNKSEKKEESKAAVQEEEETI